jgi:hypothetical protein
VSDSDTEVVPPAVRELQTKFAAICESEPAAYNLGEVQLGSYRHPCTVRGSANRQRSLDLEEQYVLADDASVAMIYREGRCKTCKKVARNSIPLFVDPQVRPPLKGRVGRV